MHKKPDYPIIAARIVIIAVLLGVIYYFIESGREAAFKRQSAEYKASMDCNIRGVDYYKAIGSYPNLRSTGTDANEAAKSACKRTGNMAFLDSNGKPVADSFSAEAGAKFDKIGGDKVAP